MTHEKARSLVFLWRQRMALQRWDLAVEFPDEDTEEGTWGRTTYDTTYLTATVKLFPAIFRKTEGDQELTIVHELSPLVVAPLGELIDRGQRGLLVTKDVIRDADEHAVEAISHALLALAPARPRAKKKNGARRKKQ